MKRLFIVISSAAALLFAFFAGTQFPSAKQPLNLPPASNQATGHSDPDIRTELKQDGTRLLWIRSNDKLHLSQYVFASDESLAGKKVYRVDRNGNPLACKIFDDMNTELFKVSFGYRKSDGKLVEEQIFDSRIKRLGPDHAKEVPVRRLIYSRQKGATDTTPSLIDTESADLPNHLLTAFRDPFENQQK